MAKVIINSRTGTIVIGQNVKVSPAAVTHGSLTVTITEDPIVSQPGPLSNGQTAVVPRSRVNAQQEAKPMFKFGPGTTLDEIVRAVNQVGAAPGDLMAILEALKQAGALLDVGEDESARQLQHELMDDADPAVRTDAGQMLRELN